MKDEITHFGNSNLFLKQFHCGLKRRLGENQKHSVDPEKVNCVSCIKIFLKKQKEPNKKTQKWIDKLSQLTKDQK